MAETVTLGFQGGEKMARVLARMNSNLANARSVSVGFLADARYPHAYRQRVDHRISPNRSTTSIAQVAFWNEYGTHKRVQTAAGERIVHVPPRPFFRTMIAEKSPEWGDSMAYLARAHDYNAERILDNMGQGIRAQLQDSIRQWQDPPNAPFTVSVKGFNKPLIDEGHMLNHVGYRVSV